VGDYASFLAALRQRRGAFIAAGARATDHGHLTADTTPLAAADAERIFAQGLAGDVDQAASLAFAANMLFETSRMAVEDGLVMQLHPGVGRNHSDLVFSTYGADKGFDIPEGVEF